MVCLVGEVTSVPLSRNITSIWPLPYGLLLQQAPEGSSPAHIPFSSLSPFLSARDTFRSKRDVNPQNCTAVHGLDFTVRGDGSSMSSLQILKDPLEEPQVYMMLSLPPLCLYYFVLLSIPFLFLILGFGNIILLSREINLDSPVSIPIGVFLSLIYTAEYKTSLIVIKVVSFSLTLNAVCKTNCKFPKVTATIKEENCISGCSF